MMKSLTWSVAMSYIWTDNANICSDMVLHVQKVLVVTGTTLKVSERHK